MSQQRATDGLGFAEDGTRLFISSIEQHGIFSQRAYLMALAGLTAGCGAGHQPGSSDGCYSSSLGPNDFSSNQRQWTSCLTKIPPKFNLVKMQQSLGQTQTFNLPGNIINLNLRIEITGNVDQKSEHAAGVAGVGCLDTIIVNSQSLSNTRKFDVEKDLASTENEEAPLRLPECNHERHKEESIAKLKEQLRLAELGCSRLQVQFQVYRLHWLEECHQARILDEYAPIGIDTCSPHQIQWDAPSPIQSDYNDEFEGIAK
ncbi:hypothetical protein EV702DRAFT_1195053 [Suillus placidus]|uniref:Uncharacterized protein n=1 Tax=Suillus placidus TaxID=48579 RepID=A0A9P6ZZH9_9AGAM|nr:hypothetical protein EV702DRAFT_1195053 [Suillus placidus]